MKVLILSVTAGYGHHATANALATVLRERGITVETVDVLEQINRLLQEAFAKGYLLSTKYGKEVYKKLYTFLEQKGQRTSKYNFGNMAPALMALRFEDFINDYDPDVIICTHVTAAHVVSEVKRNSQTAPAIGVVTDYTMHPFWEDATRVEHIILASELLTPRAVAIGIDEKRILPLGIPIHPKFKQKIPKSQAREQLNLRQDCPVVLVMGGSMGYGGIAKLVDTLKDTNMQILAVSGKNKRQYNKLMHLTHNPNLKVYGFVDNIEVLMDAADCIITKPGGLTVTESMVKGLPMILTNPIPGQEERNTEFLLNLGLALQASKTFPVTEALSFLFHHEKRRELIAENMKLYAKPDATEDLCDFAVSLGVQQYWARFLKANRLDPETKYYDVMYFGRTQELADNLLKLVLDGRKTATTSCVGAYEAENLPMPVPGDYTIVTDWHGIPQCVVRTTDVTIMPFRAMTYDICKREGEDDNLESWQLGHRKFFAMEAEELGFGFDEEMPVLFEDFELVWK
jgi:processive 1,2-diacylglycerol beta-glucosyltransferase